MLEDETSDIFIPGRFTRGAMPGDKVLVEKFEHPRVGGQRRGARSLLCWKRKILVGTMRRMEGRLKFRAGRLPRPSPCRSCADCEGSAKDGDKVAVEILIRGSRQEKTTV